MKTKASWEALGRYEQSVYMARLSAGIGQMAVVENTLIDPWASVQMRVDGRTAIVVGTEMHRALKSISGLEMNEAAARLTFLRRRYDARMLAASHSGLPRSRRCFLD